MEQDTAKTLQQPPSIHLLDFNRVSHPLIEIITLPHIHSPSTAAACVKKIQSILNSVDAVTAGMEVGGMRADVNVSVRQRHSSDKKMVQYSYYGVTGLGQRTEIKNLGSIKAVEDAIVAERDRQIAILEAGGHWVVVKQLDSGAKKVKWITDICQIQILSQSSLQK
jgi:aspartyl-tRNA(Asn)/glutamyl-tRNA(Gln) amidotransferase subunit B